MGIKSLVRPKAETVTPNLTVCYRSLLARETEPLVSKANQGQTKFGLKRKF
jgi:hypothetical protein